MVETCAIAALGGQLEAERADARQALGAALADERRDRPRVGQRGRRRQLQVEGDQRRARGDEHRAGGRVRSRRAEVGRELAVGDPAAQLGKAAAAQERPGPAAGEQPVQEDRQPDLLAQPLGDRQRLGARDAAPGLVEEDDGRDVQRAHVRVDAALGAEVDPRHRGARALDERIGQDARRRGERVDRAMVVAVGVRVEQPRPAAQVRGADGGDRCEVTTLGDVGDGEQHEWARTLSPADPEDALTATPRTA